MSQSAAQALESAEWFRNETPAVLPVPDIVVNVAESLEDFRALQTDWCALEQRCRAQFTYFQTFGWCYRWMQLRLNPSTSDTRLAVYAVYERGKLALVWPMMVRTSLFGSRVLTTLAEPFTQYANVLVDPDADADLLL
ncbi:MAG: hypothetical protein ACR2O4_16380, partial [Hyphomicrobiaceae bacterium]